MFEPHLSSPQHDNQLPQTNVQRQRSLTASRVSNGVSSISQNGYPRQIRVVNQIITVVDLSNLVAVALTRFETAT